MATDQEINDLNAALNLALSDVKARIDAVETTIARYSGLEGTLQYNVSGGFESDYAVKLSPAIVEGTLQQQEQQGTEESFAEVFNEWYRFSHSSAGAFPADATEINDWNYNESTGNLVCTVNSTTAIGFVSEKKYEDYVFEVVVSANNGDDDAIGVVFGFYVDENGDEHTLCAYRSTGGIGPELFSARYNWRQGSYGQEYDLGSTSSGLKWGDGVINENRTEPYSQGTWGWDDYPEGCRIRVERQGDIITLQTSQIRANASEDDSFVPEATITIDLNSDPRLAKFKGPSNYGYVCMSQAASTWATVARPVQLGVIYDKHNNQFLRWDGTQFVTDNSLSVESEFEDGRLYYNQETETLHFKHPTVGLYQLGAKY